MLWLIVIALLAYIFFSRVWEVHKYWHNRGVNHAKTWPLFGDLAPFIFRKMTIVENILYTYNKFPNDRYYGTHGFLNPTFVVKDIDIIKQIFIKDFDHFEDHPVPIPPDIDPLIGKNLFTLKGQQWRNMRATLSPAFTSAKMKAMFVLMSDCAEEFVQHFLKQNKDLITLEMQDTFRRYTNDIIASAAFGIKCDSLGDRENEFYVMGKDATNFSGFRIIKFFFYTMAPKIAKYFKVQILPHNVSNFFLRIVGETIKTREEKGIVRPDMIHLLMEARKGKLKHETHPKDDEGAGFATVQESGIGTEEVKRSKELTIEDITAQVFIFFIAGFDTGSSVMSFLAYELALNPDIQKRLQDEIDDTKRSCKSGLTYDALLNMKYLDMVLSETLRKWPPAYMLERLCIKPYTIVPTNPNENCVNLEVGSGIMVSVTGMHMDPKYFPNPEKFDPERFSDKNKNKIIPGSYIPFGVGPRNCIGCRFALLENKTLFYHILSKFDIVVVEKTEIPLKFKKSALKITTQNGIWLGLKPRAS